MTLEVFVPPVSDVHRAEQLCLAPGWREDADFVADRGRRSHTSFASFSDPHGNTWLLPKLTTRSRGC